MASVKLFIIMVTDEEMYKAAWCWTEYLRPLKEMLENLNSLHIIIVCARYCHCKVVMKCTAISFLLTWLWPGFSCDWRSEIRPKTLLWLGVLTILKDQNRVRFKGIINWNEGWMQEIVYGKYVCSDFYIQSWNRRNASMLKTISNVCFCFRAQNS
jgi:hypothetical protein